MPVGTWRMNECWHVHRLFLVPSMPAGLPHCVQCRVKLNTGVSCVMVAAPWAGEAMVMVFWH